MLSGARINTWLTVSATVWRTGSLSSSGRLSATNFATS